MGLYLFKGINVDIFGPFTIVHAKEAWPFGQATLTELSEDKLECTFQVLHSCFGRVLPIVITDGLSPALVRGQVLIRSILRAD